jgi:transcription elongation factor Elf1
MLECNMQCPNCDSLDLLVVTTGRSAKTRMRLRRCKDCGYELRTIEMEVSNELVRYRAPIDVTNGARRGSKLAIVPTKNFVIENALRLLGSKIPPPLS